MDDQNTSQPVEAGDDITQLIVQVDRFGRIDVGSNVQHLPPEIMVTYLHMAANQIVASMARSAYAAAQEADEEARRSRPQIITPSDINAGPIALPRS